MAKRTAEIKRKTRETDISLTLNLDGTGGYEIKSGIGFFDHMLSLFAKHGRFDLKLSCKGDLNVDAHHSVEDIGFGQDYIFDSVYPAGILHSNRIKPPASSWSSGRSSKFISSFHQQISRLSMNLCRKWPPTDPSCIGFRNTENGVDFVRSDS